VTRLVAGLRRRMTHRAWIATHEVPSLKFSDSDWENKRNAICGEIAARFERWLRLCSAAAQNMLACGRGGTLPQSYSRIEIATGNSLRQTRAKFCARR
jgi:hypothetical protein